jgi:hypothetical protein
VRNGPFKASTNVSASRSNFFFGQSMRSSRFYKPKAGLKCVGVPCQRLIMYRAHTCIKRMLCACPVTLAYHMVLTPLLHALDHPIEMQRWKPCVKKAHSEGVNSRPPTR